MNEIDNLPEEALDVSPDDLQPSAGHSTKAHAVGEAPHAAPEGMVYIPSMGTFVDADIAAQLGIEAQDTKGALVPQGVPEGDDPTEWADPADYEISDDDLDQMYEEIENLPEQDPSMSETLEDIRDCFEPSAFNAALETLIDGDFATAIASLSENTGLDADTSIGLMETAVLDVSPIASEFIGGDRWSSLVYAASQTPDPMARRIVADVVTGKLTPDKLSRSYGLWYQSLEDAE